jgi:tetratricopeptide (TPR) repeat protein
MAHSPSTKSKRRSETPKLPASLSKALDRVRGNFTDLEGWEELDEACREHDRPDEAAALYSQALTSKLSSEDLAQVGLSAADFCEEWYEETGPVLEMLSAVLENDPSQTWAFERLTVLLTVSAKWEKLLKAYDTALESCEQDGRRELLLGEAAKVARDFASRPEVASDYLKKLFLLRPDDEQLASTLERRLDEQERHQDLIDIWTVRLPLLSAAQGLKTRMSIATRQLDALLDAESSYLSVESFLEAGGEGDAACETLEKISRTEDASDDVRRQALNLLEKIHSGAERPREVISVLARSLPLAQSDEERISFYRRSAALLTSLGDTEEALQHCAEALKLNPTLHDVKLQAFSLAESSASFARYVEAIVAAANLSNDGALRVELLNEAAQVTQERLGDAAATIELYFRAESDDEASREQRLFACRVLSELLSGQEQRDALLSTLEKLAELESEQGKVAANLARAAILATELEQGQRALGLWSKRLELDPMDLQALTAKIEILAQVPDYERLVEALVARANCGIEEEAQRADLVCAAGVLSERMEKPERSISMWNDIETRFGPRNHRCPCRFEPQREEIFSGR